MQDFQASVDIAQPSHGIETLSQVLRALYAAGKPSKYKELASLAGIHPANVSQSLTALKDLGLCDSRSRGIYEITDAGADFVRYQTAGKLEDSKQVLRATIMASSHWAEIVAFLKATRGRPGGLVDLALHVERKLGKQWSQSMRSRVGSAYQSILSYAELVSIEDGEIVSRIEPTEDEGHKNQQESTVVQEDDKPGYERLQVSQFSIAVRRETSSVRFLLEMMKDDSMIHAWLQQILNELGASKDGP